MGLPKIQPKHAEQRGNPGLKPRHYAQEAFGESAFALERASAPKQSSAMRTIERSTRHLGLAWDWSLGAIAKPFLWAGLHGLRLLMHTTMTREQCNTINAEAAQVPYPIELDPRPFLNVLDRTHRADRVQLHQTGKPEDAYYFGLFDTSITVDSALLAWSNFGIDAHTFQIHYPQATLDGGERCFLPLMLAQAQSPQLGVLHISYMETHPVFNANTQQALRHTFEHAVSQQGYSFLQAAHPNVDTALDACERGHRLFVEGSSDTQAEYAGNIHPANISTYWSMDKTLMRDFTDPRCMSCTDRTERAKFIRAAMAVFDVRMGLRDASRASSEALAYSDLTRRLHDWLQPVDPDHQLEASLPALRDIFKVARIPITHALHTGTLSYAALRDIVYDTWPFFDRPIVINIWEPCDWHRAHLLQRDDLPSDTTASETSEK